MTTAQNRSSTAALLLPMTRPVAPGVADAIGPRRVGGRYRSHGEEYVVLDLDSARDDWMRWSVTVATDTEQAAGSSRTHCTAWDPARDQVIYQPAQRTGEEHAGVRLSLDNRYRYALTRDWDTTRPRVTFVMLNPSTATATATDHTIRKCRAYARSWGGGGLLVLNLFALRATDPAALQRHPDPVGPDNDAVLTAQLTDPRTDPHRVVVAWGTHGVLRGRDRHVLDLLHRHGISAQCLTVTKDGHPGHPARLAAALPLITYPAGRGA